ncbi:uncharacterized protein LOC112532558 isoform X2 [Gallus gallus]|uniref:uncharacterized protein LOC112532558 isoform X2 n=1 Tax=Gallus gallus TaxID=9031 RepID=UPI001AE1890B|nr:uncharacterized protein LOC112532558 isoform X2 [Gallus gallus]
MVMWRSKPALEPRDMAAVGTARPRGCQRAGPHRYRNGPPPERFRVTGGAQALEDSQLAHRHAPSPPLRMPELRGTHRPRASPLESVRSRAWSRSCEPPASTTHSSKGPLSTTICCAVSSEPSICHHHLMLLLHWEETANNLSPCIPSTTLKIPKTSFF